MSKTIKLSIGLASGLAAIYINEFNGWRIGIVAALAIAWPEIYGGMNDNSGN